MKIREARQEDLPELRRLWIAAEKWLRSQGVLRIKVNIDVGNSLSQGFFRNQGFVDFTATLVKKYP